jgi:colanic acid biosynthesis glycosyl transferase WcaI
VLRSPHYVPARPTCAGRIAHHLSFAAAALIPALRLARSWRPDLVFTVAPSLMAVPVARAAARVAGALLWLHVQDFEVEAAFATGLVDARGIGLGWRGPSRRGSLGAPTGQHDLASYVREADRKKRRGGAGNQIENWAEIDRVVPLTRPSACAHEWGITAPHVVLYSGDRGLFEQPRAVARR